MKGKATKTGIEAIFPFLYQDDIQKLKYLKMECNPIIEKLRTRSKEVAVGCRFQFFTKKIAPNLIVINH